MLPNNDNIVCRFLDTAGPTEQLDVGICFYHILFVV